MFAKYMLFLAFEQVVVRSDKHSSIDHHRDLFDFTMLKSIISAILKWHGMMNIMIINFIHIITCGQQL